MSRYTTVGTALALLAAASAAHAQQRWSLEVRGALAVPLEEVQGEELGNGLGLEGTLRYALLPHTAAYAGWDWIHFAPDASFAGPDLDFEETGYVFGLAWEHPFSGEPGGPSLWVRGGGTFGHVEIENADGDVIGDSDHGLGWEGALGLALPIGETLSLTPGARVRWLDREVEIGDATTDVELRYVTFELGVAWLL